MKIRKAEPADRVGTVLEACYNISSAPEGEMVYLDEMRRGFNYLVAEEGPVIGIASWVAHGLPKHGLCEMDRIAVLPEYRGRGIARSLFSALLNEAGEFYRERDFSLRKLYLLTHSSNTTAQELYRKLGFSQEATLPDHYYNGTDESVFSMFFPGKNEVLYDTIEREISSPKNAVLPYDTEDSMIDGLVNEIKKLDPDFRNNPRFRRICEIEAGKSEKDLSFLDPEFGSTMQDMEHFELRISQYSGLLGELK